MALKPETQALLDDASASLAETKAADQKVMDLKTQVEGLQAQLNTGLQDQTEKHKASNQKLIVAMVALAADFSFKLPDDFPQSSPQAGT